MGDLFALSCPSCGASLGIEDKNGWIVCEYCQSVIILKPLDKGETQNPRSETARIMLTVPLDRVIEDNIHRLEKEISDMRGKFEIQRADPPLVKQEENKWKKGFELVSFVGLLVFGSIAFFSSHPLYKYILIGFAVMAIVSISSIWKEDESWRLVRKQVVADVEQLQKMLAPLELELNRYRLLKILKIRVFALSQKEFRE